MRTRSSTAKRLLSFVTGLSVIMMCAAPSVFAVVPYSDADPEFSRELLLPGSQTLRAGAWTNTIPNALASYFTYVPLNTTDAGIAGFPASLNCGVGTGSAGSDCYVITVKEFKQAMSLDYLKYVGIGIFPGPNNLLDETGVPLADTSGTLANFAAVSKLTTAWGYGSGGNGWALFGTPIRGNAPAVFADVPFDQYFTTTGGSDKGIWHFPAPTIKGEKGRPVHVKWINQLPNHKPEGLDPTVDCGTFAEFCYPYNRIVTHVHGAHVGPESDGLATAWYTPNFALYGPGKFPDSTYVNASTVATAGPIYSYPMDQEAGTIWYHDHAVGTTHTNTNMGMAGFFPITDDHEKALQAPSAPDNLPVLPTGNYELGFALQDRHFDLTGEMRMPDYGIYDKSGMGGSTCAEDANTGLPIPGQCPRLHFMKVGTAADWHFQPYVFGTAIDPANVALNFPAGAPATDPLLNLATAPACVNVDTPFELPGQCAPFPATSATLEYFGNMPVVNGVVYGNYNVEPTVYRMRFIGGTDSRAFIMQLVKGNPTPSVVNCGGDPTGLAGTCDVYNTADIIPFYQIGSEQGLLTNPVLRNDIDIMGGERIDVLVDFSGLTAGTVVTMKNLGDDAPYSGRFDFDDLALRQPTSLNIPEIMKFTVVAGTTVSAKTPSTATTLRPAYAFPANAVDKTATPRVISLMEITDHYGRTMPTIDSRGYILPGIRTTEIMKTGDLEQWDIVNTTVDAHPMHLHQVAFKTIDRQALQVDAVTGATVDSATGFRFPANFPVEVPLPEGNRAAGVFAPAQYIPDGASAALTAFDWEIGWKDTIQCPPGYVTRVQTMFDIVGDYVWHCHILSHEEHDMMRPFRVVATQLDKPASMMVPATTDASGIVHVNVAASAVTGVQYVVQFKKDTDTFWNTSNTKIRTPIINLSSYGPGNYQFRAQVALPALQGNVANLAASQADSDFINGNQTLVYSTALTIPAATLPDIAVWTYSNMTVYAAGGTKNRTWSLASGSLPAGMILNPSTGQIYGTPTAVGTFPFTLRVADSLGATATQSFSLTVYALPLSITTASLTDGTAGVYLNRVLAATGGVKPYRWALASGALPAGVLLNPTTGQIYGTPTTAGVYPFSVTVTDNVATVTTPTSLSLTVTALPLTITTASLADGTAGVYLNRVLAATGGSKPYRWALASGALPAGVLLNPTTGQIYGAPTTAGVYPFSVTVTDNLGNVTAPTSLGLTVTALPLIITTASLTDVTAGVYFTQVLTATGGSKPYRWALASGALPAGVLLNPTTGQIYGKPTVKGSYTIGVTVTDRAGTGTATLPTVLTFNVN